MKTLLAVLVLFATPVLAGPLEDAAAWIDEGEFRRAADLLTSTLNETPSRSQTLILLTRAHNGLGDHGEAVDYGEEAIEAAPESSEAHLEYARALRIKMQNVSKMKAMFSIGAYKKELRRAIELDPSNVGAHQEQIGYLIHAPGIAGGDKDLAAERIEELKRLDWREGMWMQAELQRARKDPAAAITTHREMLERDENDEEVRMALAFSLQADEQYREADRQFGALLESEETQRAMSARYQMARTRILGEYEAERAAELLLEYIERLTDSAKGLPSRSHAHWRLGMAYEQMGRLEDARRSLERAVELDGDNKQARETLKRLGRG